MERPDDDQRLLAYLSGTLSPTEQAAFEASLETDPELAKAVQESKQLQNLLQTYQQDQPLREEIETTYQQTSASAKRLSLLPTIGWATLAAACLGLLFWLVWPSSESTSSPQVLFAEVFSPALVPERMSLNPDPKQEALDQGHLAYQKQAFSQAIPNYQVAATDTILRAEALFYLAQSLLATQQFQGADSVLQLVQNRSGEVRWYRALAALGEGDEKQAISLFQQIGTHPANDYYQEASDILEKMNIP